MSLYKKSVTTDGFKRYLHLALIFCLVTTTFFIIRSTEDLVWNDSPQTAENTYGFKDDTIKPGVAPVCRDEGAYGLRWGAPKLSETILTRSFSCLEFGGYRPLGAALALTGVSMFTEAHISGKSKQYLKTIWMLFIASLFGLLALFLFLIAREYLQTNLAAYVILLLFFCSPAVITGAWVILSGIQVLVPLFICMGLWFYRKMEESKRHRWLWGICLTSVLLLGPWIREFIGIVTMLIILMELYRYRRVTPVLVLALLGLLHAIFPTALPHLIVPKLPLSPVFELGSLGSQMGAFIDIKSFLWNLYSQAKWDVGRVFLLRLPATSWVLSGVALIFSLRRDARALPVLIGLLAFLRLKQPMISLAVVCSGILLFLIVRKYFKDQKIQIRQLGFLAVWFLLSFLPFLKVFSAHVHLVYPLVPALIIIVAATENFWIGTLSRTTWKRAVLFPIIILCLLDQILNVYGSYVTITSLYSGIHYMADWFRTNTPPGTIVIANALHAEDIRYYSNDHILPYWSVRAGVPPERTLEKPMELENFLRREMKTHRIVMLNMEQEFIPYKGNYHAHKYITRKSVSVAPLGHIHSVIARFPFIDPIRNFIPREKMLFLGTSDLENDIYFGHDRFKRPFLNEIAVDYYAYTVLDPKVSPAADYLPDSTFWKPWYLKSYQGFQLYGYQDKFFAIPDNLPLNETVLKAGSDKRVLVGHSIDDLEKRVDRPVTQ